VPLEGEGSKFCIQEVEGDGGVPFALNVCGVCVAGIWSMLCFAGCCGETSAAAHSTSLQ